jgi:hypothetical protein
MIAGWTENIWVVIFQHTHAGELAHHARGPARRTNFKGRSLASPGDLKITFVLLAD